MARAGRVLLAILLAALPALSRAQEPGVGRLAVEVEPREVTVGDPIRVGVTLELPAGSQISLPDLRHAFGELSVLSGSWQGPQEVPGKTLYRWAGSVAAYEVGSLTLPAIRVELPGAGSLASEPVTLAIRSVLDTPPAEGEAKEPQISDLKGAISIPPNFGPLRKALAALGALLLAAGVAWWLHRRYAARLAAVPAPEDPFRRMPPHVWAYEQLQHLLERRLPEEGKVDLFFSELSSILKTYLGGRYRLDLLEHTTSEVVPLLRQAGAPAVAAGEARALLERADLVKFARQTPPPEACRKAVEEAYRIVDSTRPVEEKALGAA